MLRRRLSICLDAPPSVFNVVFSRCSYGIGASGHVLVGYTRLRAGNRTANGELEMQPYTTDTSEEAFAVQLDGFRRMSPLERVRKMCQLSTSVRRMAMDAIGRRHPEYARFGKNACRSNCYR